MLDAVIRQRWNAIEPILDGALELGPDRWADYLDSACHGDLELRAAVERLLAAYPRLQDSLTGATSSAFDAVRRRTAPGVSPNTRIGPYRIVGEAGRGGMGIVYLAERADDQYRRRVALKLLGAAGADPHLVRRFLDERQILASLDHPHIAKLLDGGVTGDGLPWFALEYVEGVPIDQYCDRRSLTIPSRLALFLAVCEAVEYAHRNLVVHRDLKPSNILVTADGTGKLLDFGIAKLLDPGLATDATLTAQGGRILTPEYASPEQVRGDPVSVTTDVYSLGVLLYRLLAGRRPYHGAGRLPHEVERAVLEEEPERPSAAVDRHDERVARERGITPDRLRRRLRGDLDMIVLTALRKEPHRRYPTVDRLAADIRAHLGGQPVSAQPDRRSYRAGKFVRRHVAGIGVAGAAALLLLAFGATVAVQSSRTARERVRAERVSAFVTDLLRSPDPYHGHGATTTVREVLDSAVPRINGELRDQPEVRADLLGVIGRSYYGLGLYEQATRALDTAVVLRQGMHESGRALAENEALLAQAMHEGSDTTEAADSVARAAIRTARQSLRPDDPALAPILTSAAHVINELGRPAQAESLNIEAITILRGQPHVDRLLLSQALGDLGEHRRWAREDLVSAETLFAQALALGRDTLGADRVEVGDLEARLGEVLGREGKPEAERYLREGIAIKQRVLGPAHPDVLQNLEDLAYVMQHRGDYAPAESLLTLVVAGSKQAHPGGDRVTAEALASIGHVALMRADTARALALDREALDLYQRDTPPSEQYTYAGLFQDIADIDMSQGRFQEAERLLLTALDAARRHFGDASSYTGYCWRSLARLYQRWGKPERAREYQRLAQSAPSSH